MSKMRSLNTFAGGMAGGLDKGEGMVSRRKLLDMQGERLGMDKDLFAAQKEMYGKMSGLMDSYLKQNAPTLAGTLAGAEQEQPNTPVAAAPAGPSLTRQPQAMPLPFAGTAPNAPAQAASPFAAQGPAQATQLLQQAQQPARRLPFMDFAAGY